MYFADGSNGMENFELETGTGSSFYNNRTDKVMCFLLLRKESV